MPQRSHATVTAIYHDTTENFTNLDGDFGSRFCLSVFASTPSEFRTSKNMQFQNKHAGITIFSVHSQHLNSSSSTFRPTLFNLWLLLVTILIEIFLWLQLIIKSAV